MLVAQAGLEGYWFIQRKAEPELSRRKYTRVLVMKLLLGSWLALKPPARPPEQPMLFSERTLRRLRQTVREVASG